MRAQFSAAVVCAVLILLLTSSSALIALTREGSAEPVVTARYKVEILEVLDEAAYTGRRTLIEYDDGRRTILRGYYGKPGDTFLLEETARP